jgi:hypothetical protein
MNKGFAEYDAIYWPIPGSDFTGEWMIVQHNCSGLMQLLRGRSDVEAKRIMQDLEEAHEIEAKEFLARAYGREPTEAEIKCRAESRAHELKESFTPPISIVF